MGVIKCLNRMCPFFDSDSLDNCSHPLVEIKVCDKSIVTNVDTSKYGNSYIDALMSNECACGKTKQPKKSFCYRCYKALPRDMQRDLYRRIGNGYEEAFEEAVKYLEVNVW